MRKILVALQISVIIPVYNKIEIIEQCIALNIQHADLPCQWIIIDNASDAATKQGLKRLQISAQEKGHTYNIVTEDHNTGVAVAWNKGLTLATTEYVCILNNDCVMMPGWTQSLVNALAANQAQLISPWVLESRYFKKISIHSFIHSKINGAYIVAKNNNKFREGIFGGVVFFGKSATFNQIGNFDEQFWLSCEDIDYCVRAIKLGMKIGLTGSLSAFHLSSTTRKNMNLDESGNQTHFEKKWGWNFEKEENTFSNKKIKSWQKLVARNFLLLTKMTLKFPTK